VVLADLQIELAEEVVRWIKGSGGRAAAIKLDVSDFPAVEQAVRETVARTGRIDFIFNNAGIGITGGVHDYTIDDWNYIVDINLMGVINGIQSAYQIMIKQGFGHIVNTSSMAGLTPEPGGTGYNATKHAIVGLSLSLRAEAALFGLRVSVLCPGVIRTSFLEGGEFSRSCSSIRPDVNLFEKMRPMSPALFAKKVLNSIAKNKAIIIEPAWCKWIWRLYRLMPVLAINGMTMFLRKNMRAVGFSVDDR
jgi:NAD(P)-dependent dehydrogenase (short-subunit alcohol dehydrogenase family)